MNHDFDQPMISRVGHHQITIRVEDDSPWINDASRQHRIPAGDA
jgi:hypothetical protein